MPSYNGRMAVSRIPRLCSACQLDQGRCIVAGDTKAIRWQIIRTPDGYQGKLIVPADGLHPQTGQPVKSVSVTSPVVSTANKSPGQAKSQALNAAASLAGKLLDNPVVTSLLPPGIGPALKGVQALVSNPKVREFVREGGKAAFRMLMRKLG